MSTSNFDASAAYKHLKAREQTQEAVREEIRLKLLTKTLDVLRKELKNKEVEVWLIGSILKPKSFTDRSDIDVVVKSFHGDRFDLWSLLEREIGRDVEIIRFEESHFQEDILTQGLRVL